MCQIMLLPSNVYAPHIYIIIEAIACHMAYTVPLGISHTALIAMLYLY